MGDFAGVGVFREANEAQPGAVDARGRTTGRRGEIRMTAARLAALFLPRRPVPADQELATRALNDQFVVSFPILLFILVVRLALGTRLMETANLALSALLVTNLAAALIFRSGRVYLSGLVLSLALWAAGTFMSWIHPAVRDILAVVALFPALLAFLILPRRSSLVLAALSISSIVILQLQGPGQATVGSRSDRIPALVGGMIAVGNLAFVVGMRLLRTIRQAAETQRTLSRSKEELASILQRTPDIIYRVDPEGRITFVNETVRRYGYDPVQMLGSSVFDYLHPADRDPARQRLQAWKGGRGPSKAAEIRLFTASGGERAAEYTVARVTEEPVFLLLTEPLYEKRAGTERFVGLNGIARDITDRKRAEEALRVSEEKYSKVFHAAPAGIAISSLEEGRFLDVNEAFERIHGYRHDEIVGRSSFDVGLWADPEDRGRVIGLLKRNEPAKNLEIQGRTKDGGLLTLRWSGQLIEIGGGSYVLSTVEDITGAKRLESQLQQSQKLEAVGRLAAGIAHDFNNMLTVILGRAEMASVELAPANPLSEDIREIRRAAERSAELTGELLTFARKQDVAPRPLNLNRVISERIGMLRRLIGENVALQWNPAPGLWQVKMDPVQIDRILVNLSVNARDAIGDIGTLTVSTENRLVERVKPRRETGERPGEWVVLTVTDTGTGMSPETVAHIFEPFFTTKEIGKGTGLGLATVYGTVEHSGGWIEVQSELGKGSTFRIYLPRTHETLARTEESTLDQFASGNETVLVVEDELAILKFVRTALHRQGYTVLEATSAEDALLVAASREKPLHLLLTDLVMPKMNGRDLYEKIVTLHPEIKVVFMSGYSRGIITEPGGCKDDIALLPKPFSARQLSQKVREVLDNGGHTTDMPVELGKGRPSRERELSGGPPE